MATELATIEPMPSSKQLLDYKNLFSSTETRRVQIKKAAARLGMMLSRPLTAAMLEGWAQRLESFSQEQLTLAFVTAESTLESWPAVSKVQNLIFETEFPADYGWLLNVLKIHAADLHPKPPVHGPYQRMPDPDKPGEFYAGREVIEPPVPAPQLPARLARAAALFGQGSVEEGLARLEAHPSARGRYETASEAMRGRQQLDRDFRQAWQMARMEELAK